MKITICKRDKEVFQGYYKGVNDILYEVVSLIFDSKNNKIYLASETIDRVIRRLQEELLIIKKSPVKDYNYFNGKVNEVRKIELTIKKLTKGL